MKRIIASILAVSLTFWIANANAGDSINVEDFLIEEMRHGPSENLYCIEINDKVVWEIPLSEVETLTKEEWKDVDCLLRLIERVFSDERAIKAMINSLSPKRFLVELNLKK